ncbi:MAG: putative baseplate assembly protein [Myxococcales bacterium]|nr:putative baseplate assembly protein [Myxococcales bacterium]
MIPSPNLDDRKFEDIVQEAVRLIPQYCPEWTNHNRSDPGITLIELFAWMTEMTLYRLNRVPDKNFLAFLELMGIALAPPQPARTVLKFGINPKADVVTVPNGTRVGTKPGPDGNTIAFETENDLVVTNAALAMCMSQYHETFSDYTGLLGRKRDGVELWSGVRSVERFLFVGDKRLEAFNETSILTIRTTAPASTPLPLSKQLEWEYFDGDRWRALASPPLETETDQVTLIGPPSMAETQVGEHTGLFLRGKLIEVPAQPTDTLVDVVSMRLELTGEGEPPDLTYSNQAAGLYLKLDADRTVQPFGSDPKLESALYVACARVLDHPDADVRIDFELADPSVVPLPQPSADLVVAWEYWNGKKWRLIGRNGFGDYDGEDPGHGFKDDTQCLTGNGFVAFRRPKDIKASDVNGKEAVWVRARIERGDFGVPGTYELENDRWVWKDSRPLRPPNVKHLALRFVEQEHAFDKVMAYNDFLYSDYTALATESEAGKAFQPFQPIAEESPTLYLGFKLANYDGPNPPGPQPFPNEKIQLYFELAETDGPGRRLKAGAGLTSKQLNQVHAEQVINWEYWNGKDWSSLITRDQSYGFTQSGYIEFVGPTDHRAHKRFGVPLYWVRARLEFGGYDEPPMLRNVMLNTVYGTNVTTYTDELMGTSRGTPNQSFKFVRGPVLPGEQIWVKERERPPSPDLLEIESYYGEKFVDETPEGVLVRWIPVDSLYESKGNARHYVKDIVTNEIRFGDGIHGLIPQKGDRNILCRRYQVGDGERGNVPPDAVTVLMQAVPYVDAVRNVYAAAGGCDLETIEEAKRRGPHSLKAKSRAVTAEDFEWLSIEASNSVARVCALPTHDREGEITVVIVPKVAESHPDFLDKPIPSTELLRKVRNHLADRKLISTILNVQRPTFRELSTIVEIVVLQTAGTDRVKREIERRIRIFLHPLKGGKEGKGWPFGRPVYRVDLYHVIEDVPGVDFVDRVRLVDEATKLEVDQFKVGTGELVHVVRVEVVEKAHERIV